MKKRALVTVPLTILPFHLLKPVTFPVYGKVNGVSHMRGLGKKNKKRPQIDAAGGVNISGHCSFCSGQQQLRGYQGTSAVIKPQTLAPGGCQEGVTRVSDEALTSQ